MLPDAALSDITRRLIELSDQMGKMVVAVSDAHYMEPDDHIVWPILQHWNNNPVDSQMRHMYSTEEMLDAFDYLSEDKAYELVVKNSRLIADMCETISFCLDGEKCKEDERYNDELREICKKSLCEKYAASDLVEAKKRLEIELEAVAEANQAFTLVQLKRLMEKTNLKSCDISLRGTAGGSMVMYLLGISELDPIRWNLSFEFIFGNQPNRGMDIEINLTESKKEELMKLLGSSDGQVTGICYGNTWTVSDSADTMIEKFEKDFENSIDDEKRNKIRLMLSGNYQKRSKTFGMFLVSEKAGMENFTPLTRSEDGSLMTYFDFHYLDSTFPKVNFIPMSTLELLKKLSEQTGVDLEKIPVQSEEMLEQLKSYSRTDSPEDEIPELSSAYVKSIMKKVQPENIEDFAKVVATLHGNNVWTDIQEKYVDEGLADIKNIIATREDIFDYLLAHGIERQKAYEIAEKVRKGIVAHGRFSKWSTYKKELSEAGIPEWYIRTCEEIKYLFPRAHVISCMYMSLRCLWFKVNYPELYKEIYEKGQLERNME